MAYYMTRVFSLVALALLLAGSGGCRSAAPPPPRNDICAEILSSARLRSAAAKAVGNILNDSGFRSRIRDLKVAGKAPLMRIALFRNDTDDPALDGESIIVMIADDMFNAGLVRLCGREAMRCAAARRRSETDPDADGAAAKTALEAPRLLMTCRLALQEDRLASKKEVSALLSVQISDLNNGEIVMRTSVSWGAKKKKSFLGL